MRKALPPFFFPYYLCLLARFLRMSAFILADPLPCAPVIYCFFLALVFTLGSSFFFLSPLEGDAP